MMLMKTGVIIQGKKQKKTVQSSSPHIKYADAACVLSL